MAPTIALTIGGSDSGGGAVLLEPGAIEAYSQVLLPQAELLTPNLHEAGLLSGRAIADAAAVERAATLLLEQGPGAVLIKGGGLGQWLHPGGSDHGLPGPGASPGDRRWSGPARPLAFAPEQRRSWVR